MKFLSKWFKDPNEKVIEALLLRVEKINELESEYESLSDKELQAKTDEFKKRLKDGETTDDLLPEAFATVREAAKRTIGQRHYDVQFVAGMVLHNADIAEMKTGEGKTLSSTSAIYLNALEGKGVHVVTVNDYLAKRDCEWMGQIYHFLGLTTSCLQGQNVAYSYTGEGAEDITEDDANLVEVDMEVMQSISRKDAYAADITYGTNSEFGFDYLRDNMAYRKEDMVQRPLFYAIIDEVDSILIDEARTPLIISGMPEDATDKYTKFSKVVRDLKENEDFNIDEKMRATSLTDAGIAKVEKILGVDNVYAEGGVATVHHLENALRAQFLFKRDKDYVVKDGEVIIVDEFTGRMMQGRRYSEGLHQALEAKEGVAIQQENRTLATITIQNYFRMYEKLAGMTGTAATEAEEFSKIYELDVTIIPTNRPIARDDKEDKIYKDENAKLNAIVKEVKKRQEIGQPVLIGTIAIEKNEVLGNLLQQAGIQANILNAKQHEKEASIVAQAGKKGAVTVATNMAGRGVDIVLGGVPFDESAYKEIKDLGGLYVIGSERHESRRIDNQLRGRSGRQGDPGETQFFVSLDDDLMRIFGPIQRVKGMMEKMDFPEDMPIENRFISRALEQAQKKVEQHHFDSRKHVLEYDDVLNKQREIIYKRRSEMLGMSGDNPGDMQQRILDMVHEEIDQVVTFHTGMENTGDWNIKEITEVVGTIFPMSKDAVAELTHMYDNAAGGTSLDDIRLEMKNYLNDLATTRYDEIRKQVIEQFGNDSALFDLEKSLMLRSIDQLWIDHLEALTHLRVGIGLRGYGQKDPLVEYKKEGFRLFNELLANIRRQVVYAIYKVPVGIQLAPSVLQRQNLQFTSPDKQSGQKSDILSSLTNALEQQSGGRTQAQNTDSEGRLVANAEVGRNEPCPCGSGLKYKKCGMIGAPQHKG